MYAIAISPRRRSVFASSWEGVAAQCEPLELLDPSCPFDLANLLDGGLGDKTFCGWMLQKFAARAADQVAALTRALASRNAAELACQAQTLSQVSRNLAAHDVATLADALMVQARAGNLEESEVLVAQVAVEVTRCLDAIPPLVARMSTRQSVAGPVSSAC